MCPRSDQANKPLAQDAYDALADAYAARIATKPHNAYYERPAMLSLLPALDGCRVLDAGCGPGVYAELLVELGAEVVALDANARMVDNARARLGDRAAVIQASLEEPLSFLDDETFDLVLAALVMDYIYNWRAAFSEFHRVLKPGGLLVFSMEHPILKYFDHRQESNYFEVDRVTYTWRGFGAPVQVPSYRRPLAEVFNPLLETGFRLDNLLEPLPTAEFKQTAPQDYAELLREPAFMCIRAVRV